MQIVFLKKEKSEDVLRKLVELGCSWGGMDNELYFTVDIPTSISYGKVKSKLDNESENHILD